jgi:putative membrane protein
MSSKVRLSTRSALVLSFLMLAMLAASCGKKESAEEVTTEAKQPATAEPAPAHALTDANIAAIVMTANKMDTENARMALGKTTNAAVKAFADQMVTDHASVDNQVTDLATKLSLKPEENDTSRQLEVRSDDTREKIARSKGVAFDRAYIDNEVAYHQTVLDMLNQTLIPGATNVELKSLLESVRPAFEAHLDHAKHVQASLPS